MERLVAVLVLGYPDTSKQHNIDTDASGFGVGVVLSQEQKGKERILPTTVRPFFYQKRITVPLDENC